MKFVLEVDIAENAANGIADEELGRILRYQAGNLKHYLLTPGDSEVVYDSAYKNVGSWRIIDTGP